MEGRLPEEYRLSERKKLILKAIIDAHITYGEPVGSKYIMQSRQLTCSSATVQLLQQVTDILQNSARVSGTLNLPKELKVCSFTLLPSGQERTSLKKDSKKARGF